MSPERRLSATFSQSLRLLQTAALVLEARRGRPRPCGLAPPWQLDAVLRRARGARPCRSRYGRRRRGRRERQRTAATPARRPRQEQRRRGSSGSSVRRRWRRAEAASSAGGRVGGLCQLHYRSQADDLQATGDLFGGNQLALAGAGADVAGLLPGLRAWRRCSPRTARCGTAAAGRGRRCSRPRGRRRRNRRWPSRAGSGRAAVQPAYTARGPPRRFRRGSSAMAARSASSTQTKPGSPVQQWPHWVQVKRRPSSYHGSFMAFFCMRQGEVPSHPNPDRCRRPMRDEAYDGRVPYSRERASTCASRSSSPL